MVVKLSNRDSIEALYYVWDTKPIDHLFHDEVEQFHEDLSLANITESEYLEFVRNNQKEGLQMPKYRLSVDETRNTLKYVDIETSLNETELDALLTKIENNNELTSGEDIARKLEGQNAKVTGITPSTQSYYVEAKTIEIEELEEPQKQETIFQCRACNLTKESIEQAIEELREKMYTSINQNERQADATIQVSQDLAVLIVAHMRMQLEGR